MNRFTARLGAKRIVVLDGGFATEVESRGFPLTTALWSGQAVAERPDLVRAIHADYARSGAEILTAASYQLTIRGLVASGLDRKAADVLLERAVGLARDAAREAAFPGSQPALVAASIGSFGAYLTGGAEFHGRYDLAPDQLAAHHRPQLEVLANTAPDVFALETFARVDEAQIVCDLIGALTTLPVWVAFCLRDGATIGDGTAVDDAIRRLAGHPAVAAIGFNCSSPAYVARAVERARTLTTLPIVAYPNSGETYAGGRWLAAPRDGPPILEVHRSLLASGAAIVGGCCRTTPSDIGALARLVESSRG